MELLLEVKGLKKSYPTGTGQRLEVLCGVSFAVRRGEVVAIVGESGTGKSTLLHLLGALDRPDSGTVHFDGHDIFLKDDDALAAFRNRSVGFIFQFHHLLPEFTALENVCIPAFLGGVPEGTARAKASELLELLGMSDRATHKPSELSGGELQRVAVARSLINSPDVVLADEPSGNLDSKNAKSLHELFLRLRDELGQTFVIVTHNEELAGMSDRMLEIADGVMVQ